MQFLSISIFISIFLNGLGTYDAVRPLLHTKLRVIDGRDTTDYPYVVVLACANCHPKVPTQRFCTGTLVTDRWVLTAAHCITDHYFITNGIIMYGDLTLPLENSTSHRRILEAVPHPQYKTFVNPLAPSASKYDIGLLRVEPVPMPSYGILSSVDYKSLIGRAVLYIGGGSTATDTQRQDDVELWKIEQKDQLRPFQVGQAVVSPCDGIEVRVLAAICLRPKCSKVAQRGQHGDSGGPLLYKGKIAGVAHAVTQYSTIYVAVSPYLDWIRDVITSAKL